MYKITAIAPTTYQLNSLRAFGIPYKALGNGAYRAVEEFDSEKQAKEYLEGRARQYNDEHNESEEQLNEMLSDIELGALTLDAVTAHIEEETPAD
jgi:hypothetical protein